MTAPERICVVNCGLPAEQCACYRAMMNAAYPLVKIDPAHIPEVQALIAEARREGWSAAIEAAGALVDGSVYTSNGGDRTLEPVSPKMRGMDMHHATIAAAIRTLREETP